jgi:hypothetical protein
VQGGSFEPARDCPEGQELQQQIDRENARRRVLKNNQ